MFFSAELVGRLLGHRDLVGGGERRRRERGDALLGEARLDLLVGRLRVLRAGPSAGTSKNDSSAVPVYSG